MMESLAWQREEILIWGTTRPELSGQYKEVVCTGGILRRTKQFVRLYPIPLRYMSDKRFKKYQWIRADIAKATQDRRPESYRIRTDNIEILDTLPTINGDWSSRSEWIFHDENVFPSMEQLFDEQQRRGTSLGLVRPASISKIIAESVSEDEKRDYWDKYDSLLAQYDLALDNEKSQVTTPLPPPDFRFIVSFLCLNPECNGHRMSCLDWELDALYDRNKKREGNPNRASELVIEKLNSALNIVKNDVAFYVGNVNKYPQTFVIVGLWYPKRISPKCLQIPLL